MPKFDINDLVYVAENPESIGVIQRIEPATFDFVQFIIQQY